MRVKNIAFILYITYLRHLSHDKELACFSSHGGAAQKATMVYCRAFSSVKRQLYFLTLQRP